MKEYIRLRHEKSRGFARVRKWLLGCLTPAFAVCLAVGLFLYFPVTSGVWSFAVSFNNIVNANIGLHPKWIETTCISAKEGGVGDTYTNKHNVWHADVTKAVDDGVGNDVIMEKSSSYKFLGTEEHAEDLIREYSLKKGNEVVFNIEDGDSAAKVWADAVAFAQSLGEATPLADWTLAGRTPSQAHAGGTSNSENHSGFRVGTNTGERNMYKGNFFLKNEDGALGQYIIVRLQDDWTAKDITTTAPTGVQGQDVTKQHSSTNSDYLTSVTGASTTSVNTTSFNYVSNEGNNTPNVFGTSATYLPTATSQDGFTRIDSNDNNYVISWDLASNSCDYDGPASGVYGYIYNDTCAFSYGRINVPTGVYIVLDLNGHKIDRNLTAANYYGSVFHIDSKARLEIMDSTAYENASAARIEGTDATTGINGTPHTTNHKGTITGGKVSSAANAKLSLPQTLQANLQSSGGGFNLSMWADVVLHSGTISNNQNVSSSGGAFYQRSKAAVTIFDGYVLDNEAVSGGVTNLGSGSGCPFTMYGGVLAYNKATNGTGGAVNLAESSYGNFHGGEIMYNEAAATGNTRVTYGSNKPSYYGVGGAICLAGNTLGILDSVTIANNKAAASGTVTVSSHKYSYGGGGVFVGPAVGAVDTYWRTDSKGVTNHAFKFRGSLQVYGNTAGGNSDNIHLGYGFVGSGFLPGLVGDTLGHDYENYPKIGIGGALIANGIVARVGVTLGDYSHGTVFTSGYGQNGNKDVSSYLYFSSDNATYSVLDESTGTSKEARLNTGVPASSGLTWVIEGTGTDTDTDTSKGFPTLKVVIKSNGNATYYYKNPNNTKGLTNLTEVNSTSQMNHEITLNNKTKTDKLLDILKDKFTVSNGSITFEYSMLKVTKISAYAGNPTFSVSGDNLTTATDPLEYWEYSGSGMTSTFEDANFRFKLGTKDLSLSGNKTDMAAAIKATDKSISYAGEYSFLIAKDGSRYTNPTFKIRINQVGVVVSRDLYYKGQKIGPTSDKDAILHWTKEWIDWNGDGNQDHGLDPTTPNEMDQPFFVYSGDYYYPILNADYEKYPVFRLYNPYAEKGSEYTSIAKKDFTGYVLNFTYANEYFGTNQPVLFGEHSGGGIEYQTMHRKPNSVAGTGTYVPGVKNAGMYEVTFVSSRSAASADESDEDFNATGVYFAANNFAFSSKVNIYVDPASAEVELTEQARSNFTYNATPYSDQQIVSYDNTSDTHVNPHIDSAALLDYFEFTVLTYKAGVYDIRTGLYYTLEQIQHWEKYRPYGRIKPIGQDSDQEKKAEKDGRPYFSAYEDSVLETPPEVRWDGLTETFSAGNPAIQGTLTTGDGGSLSAFEELYQRKLDLESTGKLIYIIDTDAMKSGKALDENPTNARRYIVAIKLDLDVGYDDYNYDFDQDEEHLVGLEDGSGYFWAFEFTIDPAEVNPYEALGTGAAPDGGNTSVSLTKEHIFNNVKMTENDERLGLSVSFGSTVLTEDEDFTVTLPGKDYTNASVDANPGDKYNLPLVITFGGSKKNYVNAEPSTALGDVVTTAEGLKGSTAHEYSTDNGATGYSFVVYFRIKPVEVTVSGSLSYTYDGRSYERARYLPPREGKGNEDAWYESIFFLVQDNITTPGELIDKQHGDIADLDDLWGGSTEDMHRYQSRFTLTVPTVSYTDMGFMDHGFSLGIGLYSFNTGKADQGTYRLNIVEDDGKGKTAAEGGTTTAPREGVTWLISYQQADDTQVQAFNTSQNFVIKSDSSLEVTINPKNISELAGDITKVGSDAFTHWKGGADKDKPGENTLKVEGGNVATGISYPFAGDTWAYRPGVTIDYQPFYYATSVESAKGKTEYGDDLILQAGEGKDYTISYMNNTSATGSNSARIVLAGFGNYTGFLMLDFTITPAKIAVQYAGVGAVPQYDKTAHGVNVTYANVEDDATYQQLKDAGILVSTGGGGDFKKPQPDASVYTITYKARTRTSYGFGAAAKPDEITDSDAPINAGVYDVKILLGSSNYQFVNGTGEGSYFNPVEAVGYSNTATGSHTILPAVVSYAYANSGEIYNRQAHTPRITFTNITYEKNPTLAVFQNVVPQSDEYTVTINGAESATDAGHYTVKVELSSHNYCFSLELVTSGSLIVGYKDGSTGESYPSCEGSTESKYDYTVRSGNSAATYPTNGSWKAPGDYVIEKATIQLDAFKDGTYNRAEQPQTPVFTNKEHNNQAVPVHSGENAGATVTEDEFAVTYKDENVITPEEKDSLRNGNPFSAELYSVQISLTEAGKKNFRFETQTITPPHFTHSETADETLLTQRLGEGEDASVILAPFLINRVDINVTQLYSSDVYNAKDHFDATGAAGIALENWVSTMFQYTSSEAIQADDLTVDVIFARNDGKSATVHYTPTTSADTVEYNGKKDYTFTQFAQQGFFTHVANYTVTVQFSEKSFYITNRGATAEHLELGFEYTITPAQISFSLGETSIPYDAKEHKLTYDEGGIVLINTVDKDVLPELAEGVEADIDRGALTYGYNGWAGSDVANSDTFKNVGTYTVKLTLQEGGDFQFANGSYTQSQNYTIDAMDIGEANFGAAVFTPDAVAGHDGYKIPAYHYTGAEIRPEITLTHKSLPDITLKTTAGGKFVDLTVAYTENVNAGTAKAALTGTKNFTGTRNETFYVLPAIVSITASDSSSHTETFNPNNEPEQKDNGSLTFSYNKTLQQLTYTFENLCSSETKPTNADYTVKYYKAADWDTDDNKPRGGAVPLEAEGVTDSGDYYVWFEFTKGTREFSNFVFYKEKSAASDAESMFDKNNAHLFAYGFKVTVTPAEIQIHLAGRFKGESGFVNSFPYINSDYASILNSVTLTGENGIVPVAGEYSVEFYTESGHEAGSPVEVARNAGHYYLAFRLIDTAGNYKVTGVYAGSGTASEDTVPQVDIADGNGYYAPDESLKNISVHFIVETAKIEVYLAEQFKSGSEFVNSFVYDRSDRASMLKTVIFKNELRNNILPINTDYSLTFLKDDPTVQVINAGSYTLKFELTGENRNNFVITHVRAGTAPALATANEGFVELEKGKDYTTTDDPDVRSFEVEFTITPANIEIHLAEQFKGAEGFVNSFVYDKTNRRAVLGVVEIVGGVGGVGGVTPNVSDYTVSFKTDLSGETTETVTDVGTYYLVFTLTDTAGNYNVTGIYAGSGTSAQVPNAEDKDGKGYYSEGGDKENFSVKFEITPAQIDVYLAGFKVGGKFTTEFDYDRTDWVNKLNQVEFKGATIPTGEDYTIEAKTSLEAREATTAIDAGSYFLVFTLNNKNFTIQKVYADVKSASEPVEAKPSEKNDTDFNIEFTVKPAQIEVYLSEEFRSESAFRNSFGYNKTDWVSTLGTVQFKNVLRNGITPQPSEYERTFRLKEVDTETVKNVGDYKLVLALTESNSKNFVIVAVYAGTPDRTPDPVELEKNAEGGYEEIGGEPLHSFSVAFKITPAKIQIRVPAQFKKDDEFFNTFSFNKSNWAQVLGAVTLSGANDIVPAVGEYSVSFTLGSGVPTTDATNVGDYYLVFELTDETGNYVITGIYAGDDDTFDVCTKAGENYEALTGTIATENLKKFRLAFKVTPAELDLYLNAFRAGDLFTNSFVYDGTDQSIRLGIVDFTNENYIIPMPTAYTVTFLYNLDGHRDDSPDVEVYDVGKYTLFFRFTDVANGNYILRDVYAGPTSSEIKLQSNEYRGKTDNEVKVDFELTPSEINVFFSASDLKDAENNFVNEFYYNRSDWTNRFGMVIFDTVEDGVGATPKPSEYSIEYYSGKVENGKEDWSQSPVSQIINVGRYSVTFRLSNAKTNRYPGAQHYNNYTLLNVYAGGSTDKTGVKLNKVDLDNNPTGKDGYRTSKEAKNDVYVTLVFDIVPAPIEIHLAEPFKEGSGFKNSFVYNKSNRALTLNTSAITGTTTPLAEEYSFIFATAPEGASTETVTDVGKYYLVFKLEDPNGNYNVTGIYAGNGTDVELKSVEADGDGYVGDVKNFSVKFEITPAPITVHIAADFNGGGSFKNHFPYNKTDYATALKSVSFAGETTPDSSEYTVLLNTTGDDAGSEAVVNAGNYYLVFKLIEGGAKNYIIDKIDTGAAGAYTLTESDYTKTSGDQFTAFTVGFTVDKAQIDVYLPALFQKDGAFRSTFDYDRSNWVNKFNVVTFKNIGADTTVPTGADYTLSFAAGKEDTVPTDDATDAGDYLLIFALIDKNFEIKSIFAGTEGEVAATTKEKTNETFSVAFVINKAHLNVYLADAFNGEGKLNKTFGYNKTNQSVVLGAVQFKNVLEGGVIPVTADYTVEFKQADDVVSEVTNVGDYVFGFALHADGEAKNYVIDAVYAGTPTGEAYQLKDGDYTKVGADPFTAFTVAFAITPAELDLYLNAFRAGDLFTNSFVYDGTDQSIRLGIVDFTNKNYIIPMPTAYTVTFFYNLEGYTDEKADVEVYDVGKYTLFFQFTEAAGGNYVLRNVYAGPTSGGAVPLSDENWSEKNEAHVKVNFELTPAKINVFFSASDLKDAEKHFVNEFYYNRNDWTRSFGSISLVAEEGAVPMGSQYSIEYYSGTVKNGEEEWSRTPVTEIYNVGRYSVTFRLSKAETEHYPGARHYNNFTICNVYAGGTNAGDSAKLENVNLDNDPTGKDGYRTSKEPQNDVYITLVFDIKPNVVHLSDVRDVIFNDAAQDAGFSFEMVDEQGAVLPELARKDFSLEYDVDGDNASGNEKMLGGKPYFAGAYTVSVTLSDNFVFEKPDGERTTSGNFKITPVVLSAYLGYREGDGITEGSNSLTYDGLAHEYQIYTKTTAADIPLREGQNVCQVSEATYTGWAGNEIDKSDGYKNVGTYTLTLSFYILAEDGSSTGTPGGNFSFGNESYTISLTYSIMARQITPDDVTGITSGDHKVYNGTPQTNGIKVLIELVKGAEKTELTLYDNDTQEGDYSISNTSDINVGAVTANVNGMHNFSGTVNISYHIDPAKVTAEIDQTSLPYNAQARSRAFTFSNTSGTAVLPTYNTNEGVSDYTIAYTYNGKTVAAPRNAGVYTVTVTLKNSAGYGDSSNFMFDENLDGRTNDTTATFTFTITKAEIYLAAIPDASYTGEPLPAKIGFVNEADPSVVPSAYNVLYGEDPEAPTHVKTDGASRTPIAYNVKVTLFNKDENDTDAGRDLDNFVFVAHEGATTYAYDTEGGAWGQEAYKITPAVITGSLSVKIEGVEHPDSASNVYNAKQHVLDVVFSNVSAGFSVIPAGTKGEVKATGLAATYDFTADDEVLYTLTITFAPNYSGFTTFDGVPVNAGSYLVAVALQSADFSFVDGSASFNWTYVISNAKIAAKDTVGDPEGAATFRREYVYAPDSPHDIRLTAENFTFVEDEAGYNVENATFMFTSCTGAAYEQIMSDGGLAIGYKLTGAGEYTVTVSVDAPNHEKWDITIRITVTAKAIKLHVTADAHFEAIYGEADAYKDENVLKQVLQFIREEKITVENIAGTPEEKATTLQNYGFTIRIYTLDNSYSGAHYLKAGGYGLAIGSMEVDGFGNFVVFDGTETTIYAGTVFTVKPLAIEVATDDGIDDLHYNGASLVNDAASHVVISNLYEGDDVFFASASYGFSEGGNFNNGAAFDRTEAIHVGDYWVHVFGNDTENGLSGADSANYMIEVKDMDSPTIRYNGKSGVYAAFEIKRREVELAIADSTSIYGEAEAVYGTENAKKFNFSYIDTVLSADFGSGEKMTQLYRFVRNLLALFDGAGTAKLDQAKVPYPGAGNYMVKLDPEAGKTAEGVEDWVLGSGRFNFDKDYILRIDAAQSGTHVIEKRAMRVSVNDYSDFYGEGLKENGFEGSEGEWGFKALDEFVDGDSEKDLAITITRDGAQFTAQGSQTAFHHWVAMTYKNGLKPDSMSANYDVTFTEDSGNYIIMPRPVIVLIHSQSSVYGEPRVDDLTGSSAWDLYGTKNEHNMGYATRESRVELQVTLSIESVVNDTAPAGVYQDVIKGTSANPNYNVTFRNWVVTDDNKNEAGDRTGGDYEIIKRTVAIEIGFSGATYGTPNLREGMEIRLTAPDYSLIGSDYVLQNADDAQWKYNFDAARYTILPQDIGYLTFYLGKAAPANAEKLYATEGEHAIIGVWGYGYDKAMTFMKSYDVQFSGKWEGSGTEDPNYHKAGVFTVSPADILQNPDTVWEDSNLFRQYKEGDKTPATGWYAMQIGANYLIYAGDYTDASHGSLEFVSKLSDATKLVYYVKVGDEIRATITYSKPTNTTQAEQEVEAVGNLWNIHSVGIWNMQVTVEAANHNTAHFTYTFEIEAVVAKVMLNMNKSAMVEVYGKYEYIEPDDPDYATEVQGLPLTSALHEYLNEAILYVDGLADAYPGTTITDWIGMVLDHCWVEVVDAELSNSKMLKVGNYHLRIVAESGCGFTVAFVDGTPGDGQVDYSGYDRLIIEQKELGIDWIGTNAPDFNESKPELRDGSIIYTYSSYDYDFAPLFTGVVAGDSVEDPDFRYDRGTATGIKPKNVGGYSVVITDLLKGDDASNYKLPKELTKPLIIERMKVTVTLFDREITYGDDHPARTAGPIFEHGVKSSDGEAWTCDRLGANDYVSNLGVTLSYIDENGAPIGDHAGAGVYGIRGTASGSNYDVEFRNEEGDEADAVFTIWRLNITIHINSYGADGSIRYGDDQPTIGFTVDAETPIASWDAINELGVTFKVGNGDEKNVGSYYILGSWTNKDYNVTFVGDWKDELPADYLREGEDGAPTSEQQGAGAYVIVPRPVTVKIHTQHGTYGGPLEVRSGNDPTLWTAEGLAKGDEDDPYAALGIELEAAGALLDSQVNAGTYAAIKATQTKNLNNYALVFQNDDGEEGFGTYVVDRRTVTITVHTQRSEYSAQLADLGNGDEFWTAEGLASWHEADPYAALGIELAYKEDFTDHENAGTYKGAIIATPRADLKNYTLVFQNDDGEVGFGTYIVDKANNDWRTHFSLESMNEGETPDEELLSATAKFGEATVKYYYDELCTSEVTGELSSLPKGTYYAEIKVEGTNNYYGLQERKEFVVNENFLVVNGGLDVTLYVCIFASQFIILTFALIFIRRKKAKNGEPKEMK